MIDEAKTIARTYNNIAMLPHMYIPFVENLQRQKLLANMITDNEFFLCNLHLETSMMRHKHYETLGKLLFLLNGEVDMESYSVPKILNGIAADMHYHMHAKSELEFLTEQVLPIYRELVRIMPEIEERKLLMRRIPRDGKIKNNN